jgi:hypothetical protein
MSTIGNFGVSEFAVCLSTKRIYPAGCVGSGSHILFCGAVRRLIAGQDLPVRHWFGLWQRVPWSDVPMRWHDSRNCGRQKSENMGLDPAIEPPNRSGGLNGTY